MITKSFGKYADQIDKWPVRIDTPIKSANDGKIVLRRQHMTGHH